MYYKQIIPILRTATLIYYKILFVVYKILNLWLNKTGQYYKNSAPLPTFFIIKSFHLPYLDRRYPGDQIEFIHFQLEVPTFFFQNDPPTN